MWGTHGRLCALVLVVLMAALPLTAQQTGGTAGQATAPAQTATAPATTPQQPSAPGVAAREATPPAAETTAATEMSGMGAGIAGPPDVLDIAVSELPAAPVMAIAVAPPPVPARRVRIPDKHDVTRIGDRGVGRGLDMYSLEKEQMLGKELATDVERGAHLLRDPVVNEYVNRIGQNLVRNSDARVPFTIKVIDNDEINAFALPGGFFYVNTGLILAAENEAELAGVMAHEIAHVAARHATKNATRAQILNLASIPLIFFGGPAGYAVRQALSLAVPMSFLKFSRDAEREADMLGLEYQYASGYDPQEFVRFFETLHSKDKKKHNFLARAFATHPMTADRIKRAQAEIEAYLPPRGQYVVDTSEFQQVKARLADMMHEHHLDVGKPTLRRRGPDTDESRPPKLERK
jgi:beta-barrel assembly-enhancing protease